MEEPDRIVVTYHYVRPENSDGVTGLTPGAFRDQVERLRARYRVVGGDEFAARGDEAGLALITFDDAVRDQYVYAAPILDELGVPAVFYAPMRPFVDPPGWCTQHLLHALAERLGWEGLGARVDESVGALGLVMPEIDVVEMDRLYHYEVARKRRLKYLMAFALDAGAAGAVLGHVNAGVGLDCRDWFMTREHLVDLRDRGHTIGSHGFAHVPLTTLSAAGQREDLERAHAALVEILGEAPRSIAYPFGRRDAGVDAIVEELGYGLALTTDERVDAMDLDAVLDSGREVGSYGS